MHEIFMKKASLKILLKSVSFLVLLTGAFSIPGMAMDEEKSDSESVSVRIPQRTPVSLEAYSDKQKALIKRWERWTLRQLNRLESCHFSSRYDSLTFSVTWHFSFEDCCKGALKELRTKLKCSQADAHTLLFGRVLSSLPGEVAYWEGKIESVLTDDELQQR